MAEMTLRCCFSLITVTGALDYFQRLQSLGLVRFHTTSWKTLWVCCCLMSEKVWEDNYVHPSHIVTQFGYLAKGGSRVPRREYLSLQMMLLNAIGWETITNLSRYRELIISVMSTAVPVSVQRLLPVGYTGFQPRPLPALPRMSSLPTASAAVTRTGSVASTAASTDSTPSLRRHNTDVDKFLPAPRIPTTHRY